MVRGGDLTGRLEEFFLRLFHHLDSARHTREQIKAALRYPMLVVITVIVALVVINIFVIPAFAKVYAGFKAELPLLTKILIATSNFMLNFWPLMLAATVGAVIGFRLYTQSKNGKYQWDKFKMHIPI